jgi:two-component system phosphate regulon response regulator PhoB
MLPDIQGTEVCRRLRAMPETAEIPILMLTARDEEIDRVVGFEVGADDYVTKPFSVRELMLRVRAILRRTPAKPIEPDDGQMLTIGPLRLDVAGAPGLGRTRGAAAHGHGVQAALHLVHRAGRVQSRGQLLQDVWEMPPDLNTRTVDTHVKRLREKLGVAATTSRRCAAWATA